MTAWQDQPPLGNKPLSRRQARQSERGGDTDGQVDVDQTSAEQPDFTNFARAGWDAEARRVAAAAAPVEQQHQQPTSRRSQRSLQAVEPADTEPLEYLTQGRPQAPSTDGQQVRRRSVSAVDNEIPTSAPAYRVRDFSPEGRPAFSSTMPESPASSALEPATFENLEYRTQGTVIPPAPVENAVALEETPPAPALEERTLSRRELRAMEAAKSATGGKPTIFDPLAQLPPAPVESSEVEPGPVFPELVVPEPVVQPLRRDRIRQLSAEHDNRAVEALAEFDALTAAAPATESAAPSALLAFDPPTNGFQSFFEAPQVEAPPVRPRLIEPAQAAPSEPAQSEPAQSARVHTAPVEPSTWTPPTGHWSIQAMIDDDEQIQENTLSRNIGATSGAITTSALVIPSLPSDDMTRPLGSTGEILITGTIDLPRSFGSTGVHPARYDHSDVDALLEAGDREDHDPNPDSAPVRAIRAVSGNTSTRGVMDAKKPKGIARLPLILGVAATVMAVGVVALVIAAVVFGVFK